MQQPAPATAPNVPDVTAITRSASAADVYTAARSQRRELSSQLERLEERRSDLSNDLQRDGMDESVRAGLTQRLQEVDARISATDAQLAAADAAVAQAAAVPGAVVESRPPARNGPSDEMIAIPIVFTLAVLMPLAIAYARRIWKKGATVIAPVPREVQDKLDALAEAVESIGLEVERIGEGQRFITKVMSDPSARSLGAGAAQPIPVPQRGEHLAVPRVDTL